MMGRNQDDHSSEEEKEEAEQDEGCSSSALDGTDGEDQDEGIQYSWSSSNANVNAEAGPSTLASRESASPGLIVCEPDVEPDGCEVDMDADQADESGLEDEAPRATKRRVVDSDSDEIESEQVTPRATKRKIATPRHPKSSTPATNLRSRLQRRSTTAATPGSDRKLRHRTLKSERDWDGEAPSQTGNVFHSVWLGTKEGLKKDIEDMDNWSERVSRSAKRSQEPVRAQRTKPPVRTAAVAIKTGLSCGPAFDVVELPGQPSYAELVDAEKEASRVSDEILRELLQSSIPWEDESLEPVFEGHLGNGYWSSVTIDRHTFALGDHVFLKTGYKDRDERGSGAASLGWFATLREIRRDLSCSFEWFEVAGAANCLGSFAHERELLRTDRPLETVDCSLTSIRKGVSVSFTDGPTDDADFFCRARVSMRSSSNKDASPLEATYTLLDHMKMPAPPLDPAKLSVLELYGGTGLPGTALKDQGIGTAGRSWNLEKDAIPATTSAMNTDARAINLNIYDAVEHMAASRSGTAPPRILDEGIGQRLGDKTVQKGYYTQADLPIEEGEADVIVDTGPCPAYSNNNTSKNDEDPRKALIPASLSMYEIVRPKYIILENVEGITRALLECRAPREALGRPLNLIISFLLDLGYSIAYKSLSAVELGSGQDRRRLILIATLKDYPLLTHPEPTHSDPRDSSAQLPLAPSAEDLMSDLPAFDCMDARPADMFDRYVTAPKNVEQLRLRGGLEVFTHHMMLPYRDDTKRRVMAVEMKAGANFYSIPEELRSESSRLSEIPNSYYARQAPTDPLRTIICSANPGSYTGAILHYEQNRCYSLREFARGQGFGDWWRFEGKPHEVMRQIGNAATYHFFAAIGAQLARTLSRELNDESDESE